MRTKRDLSRFKRVHLKPETKTCPACGQKLVFAWNADRRVAFLFASLEIEYHAYRCTTPGCPLKGQLVKPLLFTTKVLRDREFGLDVIALIGYYRLKMSLSIPKIRTALVDVHAVLISEREVEDLFDLYVALASRDARTDPALLAKLRAQGRLVLTIDAAKPDADGEALWLVRDEISDEVLLGFTAPRIDAPALAAKIGEVRSLGIPIAGVVSDAEPVVIEAISLAFPGVPHHLCQYHFLADFAKGVTRLDSELSRALEADVKGLKRFEDAAKVRPSNPPKETGIPGPASLAIKVETPGRKKKRRGRRRKYERLCRPRNPAEAEFVRDVCEAARAALGRTGRPPLDVPGLESFRDVDALDATLERAARKKGVSRNSSAGTCTTRSRTRATSRRK